MTKREFNTAEQIRAWAYDKLSIIEHSEQLRADNKRYYPQNREYYDGKAMAYRECESSLKHLIFMIDHEYLANGWDDEGAE